MNTEIWRTELPAQIEMERAFTAKDKAYDGLFYAAIKTTGVFCRPSCPSQPKGENVEYFASIGECLSAGYRPCKRCRPLEASGSPPAWVAELMTQASANPDVPVKAAQLRALGISPERARRWFRQHYGMSFAAWCRGQRLAGAFEQLRDGASLDDATFASGFESHSGFRDAFRRAFGTPPGRSRRTGARLLVAVFESPLGAMVAAADDAQVRSLSFSEQRPTGAAIRDLQRAFQIPMVPGKNALLRQLQTELKEYFAGTRREFTVAKVPMGTPFQMRVWAELMHIPYGSTLGYGEVARRLNQPAACRAVAQAIAMNPVCVLIPCHRVLGKHGALTGYAGGVWRKRLLLQWERAHVEEGCEGGAG